MINSRSKPPQKPGNGRFSLIITKLWNDISTLCRRESFLALHRATYGNKIVTGKGSIEVGMVTRT